MEDVLKIASLYTITIIYYYYQFIAVPFDVVYSLINMSRCGDASRMSNEMADAHSCSLFVLMTDKVMFH